MYVYTLLCKFDSKYFDDVAIVYITLLQDQTENR